MDDRIITINGKRFKPYMDREQINTVVHDVAMAISHDLKGKSPLFCPTLTGAYIFMADLARALDFDVETFFVKYNSYQGMHSTGKVETTIPFPQKCTGRHVVIVEDIVDTGITMRFMIDELKALNPASIRIATLLFKPFSFKYNFKIDYVGRQIPDDFIVGYGMDYDEQGRGYGDIYVVDQN